jgi:arylsulfatase A-like enzyme
MNKYKPISLFSIFIIIGFIIGLIIPVSYIIANNFIQYKFYRLIAFNLQESINKWIIINIICFAGLIFLFLFYWLTTNLLLKLYPSNRIVKNWRDKENLIKVVYTSTVCTFIFIGGGWAINYFFLPGRLHPISLLSDLGILIFSLILVWISLKSKLSWVKILQFINSKKSIRLIAFVFVLLVLILNTFIFIDTRINVENRPNIVILISDALRRDHLGCYGYERNTTPNIDQFSKDARLYKNGFAQAPSTKSSIASLFTSKYPSQHKMLYNVDSFDLSHITLAEVMRENKYMTGGFIENYNIIRKFKYDQGFKKYELINKTKETYNDFDNKIFSWIKKNREKPFFLYVHYVDPHSPYDALKPFYNHFYNHKWGKKIRATTEEDVENNIQYFKENENALKNIIASYDEEILYIDSRFNKFVSRLRQMNILDNTIFIFLSDHAEGFLEHDYLIHVYSVYSDQINIPFIIRYPKLFEKGEDEKYVQHIDIFPTLMHILNINSDHLQLEGNNILSESDDVKIFCEHLKKYGTPQQCIIYKDWKLIKNIETNIYSMYNIKEDPNEQKNLIEKNTKMADLLKRYLFNWENNLTNKREAQKIKLDDETRERLRSLGYI